MNWFAICSSTGVSGDEHLSNIDPLLRCGDGWVSEHKLGVRKYVSMFDMSLNTRVIFHVTVLDTLTIANGGAPMNPCVPKATDSCGLYSWCWCLISPTYQR